MTKLNELTEKYSHLFPTNFYFACGDGWYNILDCLLFGISWELEQFHYNKLDTFVPYEKRVPVNPPEYSFRITQVKEKFGDLRFYYSSEIVDPKILGMIRMAEMMSARTCEITGNPGKLMIKNGFLKTVSAEKAIELGYKETSRK